MLLKPDVGDAELITAVRGGDLSAYGTLFERHVEAARRLARQLTNTSDADDLVSDAFAKVLRVLQNGGGPDLAFRAYLLTAVRRLHVDKIRAGAKVHTTDDLEKFDPGVPFRDTAVEGFENSAAAAAFASLPERWQLVLWHTEVEGQKPADVAELLGMSANSVSALAYRAREGLRQAFLNSHIQELDDTDCRWTHDHLGAYVRNGVSKRDGHKVEEHLDGCRKCMAIYLELTEVNSNLSGILAPIVLGGAAAGYLASGATVVKAGFLLTAFGRARDGITSNVPLSAAVGVAAVSTVVGVSVAISLNQGGGGRNAGAEPPNAPVASSSSTTGPTESQATDPTSPDGNDPARRVGETSSVDPSATTDATATDAAASETADATDLPSDGATDPGGSGDTDGPGDNPGGPVGNPPETQPEFDYNVPQGQRTTTIFISELVQDVDGDELSFVDASLQTPDHGDLDITSVTVPTRGTAAAARTEEALVYVPDRGWGGRELVTYRVTDGHHTVRGTFRIRTVNDPPVANDETRSTPFGEAITVDLLANDTDPDGDPLTLFSYEQEPAHGTVTRPVGLARLFADASDEGVVIYRPDRGWEGVDTVSYVVDDGAHQSPATLTVTTEAAPPDNEPPVIDDDDITETTEHDTPVTIDVIERAGITDPDGDPVTLDSAVIQAPAHGTVEVFRATGLARLFAADSGSHLVYTPNSDWAGTETITYVVSDGRGGEATGTLRVTTQPAPANRAPLAVDDDKVTAVGQPITVNVIANDTDEDGDPLHLVSAELQEPRRGRIEIVGDEVTYYPAAGFLGTATITYVVSDGRDTDTGVLTVETLDTPPVNRAPVTVDDFAETGHAQTVIVDVAADDTDPDGDPVTLASTEDDGLHGDAVVDDGKLSYTPDGDWAGDDTVTYTVTDGRGGEATGILTVRTLEAPPVNRAPITVNDFAETGHAQTVIVDVAADDTDPDGDPVTLASTEDDGLHGDAVVDDGKLSYTPDGDWAGDDTVTYTVTDGRGGEATGILTVRTLEAPPVNRAPITVNDFAETGHAQTVIVDVAADDTDPDGDPVTLASTEDDGLHGDAVVDDGKLSYTPDGDWAGDDTVTYTVTDGRGGEATGILTVKTLDAPPANHAPAAENDFADTEFETPVSVDVLTNDTDGDGDDLTLVPGGLSNPANGSAEVVDGELVYTPNDDWAGEDTVTYTVTDGTDTDTAVLTVTTNPANRPPVTHVDNVLTDFETAITVDVAADDTDPDGDPVTLLSTENDGEHGDTVVSDGKLTYTPDDEWFGSDNVTYTVSDGRGGEATGRLHVTTRPRPNQPPVITSPALSVATDHGDAVTVDLVTRAGITDPDDDPLTLTSDNDTAHGSVTVAGGTLTYTPDDDWAGDEALAYTATDGRGGRATGTVTVTTRPAEVDLGLSVTDRDTGVNQRFTVTTTGMTPGVEADLVITWSGLLSDVRDAPDFCEEVSAGRMVCHLTGPTDPFEMRFFKLLGIFSVRMELTPVTPYVDPTPNIYTWP